MASVPGKVGWPVVGDKSYEFYKNPLKFLHKHMEQHRSRIFAARFLNTPTVFVGSNNGVADVLADGGENMELGYKVFMGQIYGDNILFTNGEDAKKMRVVLSQLFTEECVCTHQPTIDRVLSKEIESLDISRPICLYAFFKRLVTEICLSLFLGLDFQEAKSAAETIVSMTTTHWHGIISVPLPLKIPGTGNATTFGKALDAKKRLLDIIRERRRLCKCSFSTQMEQVSCAEDVFVNNHILLFTSALVPKAISSILTSFAIEVSQGDRVSWQEECLRSQEFMDKIFLEVQRLYPPFLGGRRVVKQECVIDGYKVPKGHAIVFMTYAAHQDPSTFDQPEEFCPERWKECPAEMRNKLFCFGAGRRGCVGQKLVWSIIQSVSSKLLTTYTWKMEDGQDVTHKWLPVSRPKGQIMARFTRRTTTA